MKSISALHYLDSLRAQGIAAFTSERIRKDLFLSPSAATLTLWRMRRKTHIATPVAGYHVIVPPEYRSLGCPPADQFIDGLMTHLKEPYYASLLSAAEIHGAAHQRPQVFQVMVRKKRKPIKCGSVQIEFYVRKNASKVPFVNDKVSTGYVRVSSPEATAIDLVGYMQRAGGLGNVATVLAELRESLNEDNLVKAARLSPVAWAQRLGCLLQLLGLEENLDDLAKYVNKRAYKVVGLAPWKSIKGARRAQPWKVAVNESLEPDTI